MSPRHCGENEMKLSWLWAVDIHDLFGILPPVGWDWIRFVSRVQSKSLRIISPDRRATSEMPPMRSRGMELHSLSLTDSNFISRNRLHVVNPVWNSKPRITAACSRGMDGLFMKLSRSIISDPNVAVVAPAGLTPEFKEGRYHRLPPMACYGSWSFWLML